MWTNQDKDVKKVAIYMIGIEFVLMAVWIVEVG